MASIGSKSFLQRLESDLDERRRRARMAQVHTQPVAFRTRLLFQGMHMSDKFCRCWLLLSDFWFISVSCHPFYLVTAAQEEKVRSMSRENFRPSVNSTSGGGGDTGDFIRRMDRDVSTRTERMEYVRAVRLLRELIV